MNDRPHVNDRPAEAAILAATIGAVVLGLATVLSEASPSLKGFFTWWAPAGLLVGKTGLAVIAWLVSWVGLHVAWRKKELPFYGKIFRWAIVLIALGWLGTFPPIFGWFARH